MVTELDDLYIVVMGRRFHHDRTSLKEISERIARREVMVEVGSLAGFSTRVFTQHFNKVISVDPYRPGYDAMDGNSNARRLELARSLFLLRFFDDPRVEQLNVKSTDAAGRFDDASLDFVYVDGDHTYQGVKDDLVAWLPKIRPGGFIGGDDYDWGEQKDVQRAVREILGEVEIFGGGRWLKSVA